MFEIIVRIATIIGSLGTLGAVLWAVYVFRRSRIDSEADRFRRDIIELVNQFEEIMAVFQDNVVATCKKLFDPELAPAKPIFQIVLSILNEKTDTDLDAKVKENERILSEWVLYSLDTEDLRRAEAPRFQCFSLLQSIRGFLPVMYDFINSLGEVVLAVHKSELNVVQLREYVRDSIKILWKLKQKGTSIASDAELQLHWRGAVSANINHYKNDVDFVDVFNATRLIIREYVEIYLKEDNVTLWKDHLRELQTDLASFKSQSRSEKLTKIAKWKIGIKDPDRLAELVKLITNFEQKFS